MNRLRVAILGGSFNPPTLAHMSIGTEIMKRNLSDLLFYVPCAHRTDKQLFLNKEHRLKMLELSIQHHFNQYPFKVKTQNQPTLDEYRGRVAIDTYEIDLYQEMLPTEQLFKHYQLTYPDICFQFVIGSDLLDSLEHWEGYDEVLKELDYLVFERGGYAINTEKLPPKSTVIAMEEISFVSSTQIRQIIQQNKRNTELTYEQLNKLICQDTANYIIRNSLYAN